MTFSFNSQATQVGRSGKRKVVGSVERFDRALLGHTNALHCGKVDKKCAACAELLKRKEEAAR